MFEIVVFNTYNVDYKCEYTYIEEEGDYATDYVNEHLLMTGGELVEVFAERMKDAQCINCIFDNNTFESETFNPDNGTGAHYTYTLHPIKTI